MSVSLIQLQRDYYFYCSSILSVLSFAVSHSFSHPYSSSFLSYPSRSSPSPFLSSSRRPLVSHTHTFFAPFYNAVGDAHVPYRISFFCPPPPPSIRWYHMLLHVSIHSTPDWLLMEKENRRVFKVCSVCWSCAASCFVAAYRWRETTRGGNSIRLEMTEVSELYKRLHCGYSVGNLCMPARSIFKSQMNIHYRPDSWWVTSVEKLRILE